MARCLLFVDTRCYQAADVVAGGDIVANVCEQFPAVELHVVVLSSSCERDAVLDLC